MSDSDSVETTGYNQDNDRQDASQPKASDHGLTADSRISISSELESDRLKARLLELSVQRLQTLADRAESVAIILLTSKGHVTADEVWEALLRFNHIANNNRIDSPYDGEWLDPLHRDLATAWGKLQEVIAGIPVAEQPPGDDADYSDPAVNEAYYTWSERQKQDVKAWYVDMMRQLDSCVGMSGPLSSFELTEHLPREVAQAVQHDYDNIWRSSPLTVGASLCELPSYSRFFGHTNGPALLKVLACTVQLALKACDEVKDDEVQFVDMLGLLNLHWMLLKGFVYATTQDSHLLEQLPGHPEAVDLAVDSLSLGLMVLNGAPVKPTPMWKGHIYTLDETIRSTPTSDLIVRLRERVNKYAETYGQTGL